ncbi:MAG: N-acetylglucosamine kinase [Acetobacteraceae bacterium]
MEMETGGPTSGRKTVQAAMTDQRLFLGIDGGQSSTLALIGGSSGQIIGAGRGGPCNHAEIAEGRARFIGAVRQCVAEACAQAGFDPGLAHFESACCGFSGGPQSKESLLREIIQVDRLVVASDAWIALAGALSGESGIAVIAGTGSIALGRNSAGQTAQAGGWGYIFGDEGSAFDMARQALRASLRFEESWGPSTQLYELFLAETGAPDANDLLHRFYTGDYPRARVASYAKLVDRAARNGDAVARQILRKSAAGLIRIADVVRAKIFSNSEPVRVAFIGGVFQSAMLLEDFRVGLSADGRTTVQPGAYPPAVGALFEAYRNSGIQCALPATLELNK